MKAITPGQIRIVSLITTVLCIAGIIYSFNIIKFVRDITTKINPSFDDQLAFEFKILAILFSVLIALLTTSLSSWIASAHSHALSRKKHFIVTAEGACDELTKSITSYSYNNGNDKESTEQQIRTCRILCDKFLTDSFFDNKDMFNAWRAVGWDIEILISLKKLDTALDKELDIELDIELVQKLVTELVQKLDTELDTALVQKLDTALNKELYKNLAKELDIELAKRLDSTVEKLIELRMMITKTS